MVELLVVMAILAILISIISVASSSLISQSKATNTRAVLQVVNDAIQEFKRERPAMLRPKYLKRYGPYPPDELEVFDQSGFNRIETTRSLAPGGAKIEPAPPYGAMRFYTDGDPEANAREHRDLAAMIVAIETLTESAAALLDRLPEKNRSAGASDSSGNPSQFLDRPDSTGNLNGQWGAEDLQIRYILDDWGVPLGYLAQRDWTATGTTPTASNNHNDWNQASTELIRLNGAEPLIFSYGPDGKEQLTRTAMEADNGHAALIVDYLNSTTPRPVVDHPYNADNVYLDPTFGLKLSGAP